MEDLILFFFFAFMQDVFLFDTSGKSVFKDLTEVHYDKLGMFVIVFDVTDKESFENCQKWMKKLKQYLEPDKSIPGTRSGFAA